MATIEELKENDIASYKYFIQNLSNTKELWLDMGEYIHFSRLGRFSVFEENSVEAKKYFHKATKIAIEYYHIYRTNRYPNLIRHKTPSFSYVGSILAAILCDDAQLLKEYAETIAYEEHPAMKGTMRASFTYSLKYLLLNDFAKSKEYLELVHHPKNFQLHFKGFSHIVKGILENDVDLVNEGISYRIKYHKRDNPKGSAYYDYSVEITALAKLAMLYGLKPNVDSAFIHKGLLAKTEGIEYEGIEEILNALEEANFKAGK